MFLKISEINISFIQIISMCFRKSTTNFTYNCSLYNTYCYFCCIRVKEKRRSNPHKYSIVRNQATRKLPSEMNPFVSVNEPRNLLYSCEQNIFSQITSANQGHKSWVKSTRHSYQSKKLCNKYFLVMPRMLREY